MHEFNAEWEENNLTGGGPLPPLSTPETTTKTGKLFHLLNNPQSSKTASYYRWYLDFLVAISIIKFCVESVPTWSHSSTARTVYFIIESFVSLHLLFDFVAKLAFQPTIHAYSLTVDCVIDGLSVLPWVVDLYRIQSLLSEGTIHKCYSFLRLLRLLRFVRFMRLTMGNMPHMKLFMEAVRRSGLALTFLSFYVIGAGLFFSGCLYYAETSVCYLDRDSHKWLINNGKGDPCAVQNMFEAIWLCIVTMSTVGYGDIIPQTVMGKIISGVLIYIGMICLPLPAAIFGANLTELYLESRLMKGGRTRGSILSDSSPQSLSQNNNFYYHRQQEQLIQSIDQLINEAKRLKNELNTKD